MDPPNDLASNAWMNKIAIICAMIYVLPKTIFQQFFLLHFVIIAYWYYCRTANRYAIHLLILDIRNWEIKRRFRSIDKVAENFVRCQTKMIGACMYHWTSCTYKKLCMHWDIIHIMLCYSQYCRCMWSISDKHLEEETMMRVWEQNNYRKSSITWFRDGVDLGAASRLVTRLESRFESVCCENRAPLVVGSFSVDMSFSNLVDCNPSKLKTYILPNIIMLPEWRGN